MWGNFPEGNFPPYQREIFPIGQEGNMMHALWISKKKSGNVDAFEIFIAYVIDLNDIS